VTGAVCAALLQALTSRSLGLVVGGKPILAWPAFGVIIFELTLLFAGVTNFLAMALLAAAARRRVPTAARAAVGSERIVVVVPGERLEGPEAAAVLRALEEGRP
jgi:hypothetical protein